MALRFAMRVASRRRPARWCAAALVGLLAGCGSDPRPSMGASESSGAEGTDAGTRGSAPGDASSSGDTGATRGGDAAEDPTGTGEGTASDRDAGDEGSGTGNPACGADRTEIDRPDDSDDPQVHVVYVLPADGVDRGLDVDGTLAGSAEVWNSWLAEHTGGPQLRLDTCDGVVDVTFFAMDQTDAEIAATGAFVRDEIEAALASAGAIHPDKLYAVYYDGSSTYACGGAAFPPTLVGRVGALYLQGTPPGAAPCPQNFAAPASRAGYLEHAMLHELVHSLGLVADCGASADGTGHSTDDNADLMYAGSRPWLPGLLDPGNDDYWQHGNPSCPDLATSALMEPMPAGAWLPPGW